MKDRFQRSVSEMNSKMLSVVIVLMMCLPALAVVGPQDGDGQTVPDHPDAPVPDMKGHDGPVCAAGTVLVRDSDFSEDELTVGHTDVRSVYPGSGWYEVTLPEGADEDAAVEELLSTGNFDEVVRDVMMTVPADVLGGPQDGSGDSHLEDMGITEAWDILESEGKDRYGSRDVVVAVVDTGADLKHEALKDNIWVNEGEIPGNGIDDDGNGFVDDVHGWNFCEDNNRIYDTLGHGTHVSGIVAGHVGDTVIGAAPGCTVMPVKISLSSGLMASSDIYAGIRYAVDNGADIVNLSLGGYEGVEYFWNLIEDVGDRCLLTVAAGNDTFCINPEHGGMHKTGVDFLIAHRNVLSVMNAEQGGKTAAESSNYDDIHYGRYELDTYAVGTDIYSCLPGGGYGSMTGTSMAAPSVAGIAALLLTHDPDMTPAELRAAVAMSGDIHPYVDAMGREDAHTMCDAADALNAERRPDIGLLGHREYTEGVTGAVAGKDCRIGIGLVNLGFEAESVVCTLSSDDPYVEVHGGALMFGHMDADSAVEGGFGSAGSLGFDVTVSPDCPADHLLELEVTVSCDGYGPRTYGIAFHTDNTVRLESLTGGRTVMGADRNYVLDHDITVAEGAELVFGEGCQIEFRGTGGHMPVLTVHGTLVMEGSDSSPVVMSSESGASIVLGSPDAVILLDHCTSDGILLGGVGTASEGITVRDSQLAVDLPSVTDAVFRFDAMERSSLTCSVPEVRTGDMFRSMLCTRAVDTVTMDPDSSVTQTLVEVGYGGCRTEFHLAGSIIESVFTNATAIRPGQVSFDADPDTVHEQVCFHNALEPLTPFEDNCRYWKLPTQDIWPFIVDVTRSAIHSLESLSNRVTFTMNGQMSWVGSFQYLQLSSNGVRGSRAL